MLENQENKLVLLEDLGMLYPNESSKEKKRYGIYKCACGNKFKTQTQGVKNKRTKSCGCLQKKITAENNKKTKTTHGLYNTKLYRLWNGIMQRCTNPNRKDYINYGGRGITVCDRWRVFKNFIDDMYPTFKEGLSIDRINNDLGYSPENCRWATKSIQARNRRISRKNTSKFKGVCFHKIVGEFRSRITVSNKRIDLGTFKTAVEGAIAYNNYIIENNLEGFILNEIPQEYLEKEITNE